MKKVTGHSTIELINNEYIEYISHPHITGSNMEYLYEDVKAFKEISNGNNYPIIAILHKLDKVDSESEKYIRGEVPNFFNKIAIVSTSVWTVYTFNLLTMFMKFPVPFKLFKTKEEAITWIRK